MNKSELIGSIASKTNTTKVEAERFLEAFIGTVTENMATDDGVKLLGFGTFIASERKARTGRNPQTGAAIQIAASVAPTFKPGAQLKAALNKSAEEVVTKAPAAAKAK